MIKKITLLLIITSSTWCYAQESILFKNLFKPNKKYTTQVITSSSTEMDFIADSLIMNRIKKQGITLPIISESKTTMSTELTTLEKSENGEYPAIMKYGKIITSTTINGEKTTKEKPYSGMKILGHYNLENKLKVDTIIGNEISHKMRNTLKTTLETIQEKIKFPDKPLKIGDNFTRVIPMTIPIEGMNPLYIKINIEYLLKQIKGTKALFDLKQTITIDTNQEQLNAEASGTGTGISEYDIAENYLTRYKSEMPINITVQVNEKIGIKMKMLVISEQNVVMQ